MDAPKATKDPLGTEAGSRAPSRRPGQEPAKRERARLIGLVALGVLAGAFAAFNLDSVEVNWLLGTWSTPLIVVIVVAMLFGMAIDRMLVRRARKRSASTGARGPRSA
jgi:uncharacterized integral membrane protein